MSKPYTPNPNGHHASCAVNAAVLDIINASSSPMPAMLINDRLSAEGHQVGIQRLRYKLSYLVQTGKLTRTGHHTTSAWAASRESAQAAPQAPAKKPPEPARQPQDMPWVGQPTPAPAIDLMHRETYVPALTQTYRPGSLDYKRCASVGHAC